MNAICLCGAVLVLAQQPAEPRFAIHTLDGTLASAPLQRLAGDFTLRTGGTSPAKIAGASLLALRQTARPLPRFISQNVLIMNNGDRIPVDVKSGWRLSQDRFHFRPGAPLRSDGELDFSLNYAAVLCLAPPKDEAADDQDLLLARLLAETRKRDAILLMDGDRIEGKLKKLDSVRGATLGVGEQEMVVAPERIRAIAFDSEFGARPRVRGPFAQLTLIGGARLGLKKIAVEEGKSLLTGQTMFGGAVAVPLSDLCSLDIRHGPADYLSDLPSKFEQTPFLGVSWPMTRDAGLLGCPLRLGPDTYAKGLGMHCQSRVTFKLPGTYRWLEAVVGLDERHGRLGRVRLKVLVDGKERALTLSGSGDAGQKRAHQESTSPLLTWADGPKILKLDIRGARTLTLMVDCADFGDVQGRVNWADAKLIR